MTELLTTAQMRAAEEAEIGSGVVSGLELMERAGQGVVAAIFERWPELAHTSQRALVLCGPGNNGGDGFVIARLLKEAGWQIDLLLFGDAARLPPDARTNHDRWIKLGQVRPLEDPGALPDDSVAEAPDLIVDAIFGTGLTRALPEVVTRTLSRISQGMAGRDRQVPCVAVDIPSGLSSDTGRALGCPMSFDLAVTFHSAKLGHYLADGPALCGALRIADIGLRRQALPEPPAAGIVRLTRPPEGLGRSGGHKYTHGHAVILSGGAGRTGAARLAARGALRIGAGLVTLGVPGAAQLEVASQVTAIMLARVDDAAGLSDLLGDARLNALCIGPGLGLKDHQASLVEAALKSGRPTVLDADALSLISGSGALFAALHAGCVLTPHEGEFARLFPDIAQRLGDESVGGGPAFSKVDAAREAARRAGCVVLLKGPDTIIAAPDGRCAINASVYDRAAPWLATAGSGDVLAGLITGLLARGFDTMRAAEAGAWLHTQCAIRFGPGLIAEDVPEELPAVLRALGL